MDYCCVTVARSGDGDRDEQVFAWILECVWVATVFGHRNLVNKTTVSDWHDNGFISLVYFRPGILPISEIRFVDLAPLPLLLLLVVVTFSQNDTAAVITGLKALFLVCLVFELLGVQVIPNVLIAMDVVAGMQLNRVANWLNTVGSVGVINDFLVLAE